MTNLIERITEAIIRQEGMSSVYENPGNLRAAPWLPKDRVKFKTLSGNGLFWAPENRAQGVAGAAHCIALRIAMGQTLAELISAWAPPSENNTRAYIANVKLWASIPDENIPLWDYLEVQGNGDETGRSEQKA